LLARNGVVVGTMVVVGAVVVVWLQGKREKSLSKWPEIMR